MAYRSRMRQFALEEWRFASLVWQVEAPFAKHRSKPPAMPPILGSRGHGNA